MSPENKKDTLRLLFLLYIFKKKKKKVSHIWKPSRDRPSPTTDTPSLGNTQILHWKAVYVSINHWECMTANIEPSMCLTDVVAPERVSDSLDEDVKALASIWREVPSRAHDHASLKLQQGPICVEQHLFVWTAQMSQMPSRGWTDRNCLGHKHSFPCEPLHFTPSELCSDRRLACA